MHNAIKLHIGDQVIVPRFPEFGVCTIAKIHRNVQGTFYGRNTFYVLDWEGKNRFEMDAFLLSELDLPRQASNERDYHEQDQIGRQPRPHPEG